MNVKIENSWAEALRDEFEKEYFINITSYLKREIASGLVVYPKGGNIFKAFDTTPLPEVKVVILGQDPYHGEGQAHGLSFSVPEGVHQPPSLQNIFKELHDDLGCPIPQNGTLSAWANQGVFLLNTVLTVRAGEANSHRGQGWEIFTDEVIKRLSAQKEHLVFILWGSPAGAKASLIDAKKHLILRSVHPSPLSSYRGFFGSKPFSKSNDYLIQTRQQPIQWCLS